MIETPDRRHFFRPIVLAATLTVAVACGRSSLLAPAPPSSARGKGGVGGDGGKIAIDASPDHGADPGEPDRPSDGRDGAPDADAGPDRPADAGPDRGSDLAGERALDAAGRMDLAAADTGRADAPARDRPPSAAEAGMLELVAGRLGSRGAHDGIGSAARFDLPGGMTTDGMGTLFVADSSNHTIRKIVLATGEVTTLAGSAGDAGSDDGIGSARCSPRRNTGRSLAGPHRRGPDHVRAAHLTEFLEPDGAFSSIRSPPSPPHCEGGGHSGQSLGT
jgi:hypothetical protein